MLGRRHHIVERAVDPVADPYLGLLRFHVDVAGALPHGLDQHEVDQTHDRGFVDDLAQLVEPGLVFPDLGRPDLLDDLVQRSFQRRVLVDRVQEPVLRDDGRNEVAVGDAADVIQGQHIERIDHPEHERFAFGAQRQHLIAADRLLG